MLFAWKFEQIQILASCHYVISAIEVVIAGIILVPKFVKSVCSEIDSVMSSKKDIRPDNRLVLILDQLNRFMMYLWRVAIINFVLACLFGFWPFLQINGSSYFLPFAWTSGTIPVYLGLYIILQPRKGKRMRSALFSDKLVEKDLLNEVHVLPSNDLKQSSRSRILE